MNELITDLEQEFDNREDFPVEVFPSWIHDYILTTNKNANWPVEASGVGALIAVSTAAGAGKTLNIRWPHMPSLFCCIVGRPGTNKTHPLNGMLLPVSLKNDEFIQAYNENLGTYNSLPKKERETAAKPFKTQIITSDTTIEALGELLNMNPEGILIHKDELNGFFGDMNRYSNGGGDVEKILEAFSHQTITVNRKGDERVIHVQNPVINVAGTIQPRVLGNTDKSKSLSYNGMLDRILFININSVPSALPEDEIGEDAEKAYVDKIGILLSKRTTAVAFKLCPEARKTYFEAYNRLQEKTGTVSEIWAGILSKLQTYFGRLILVLHIAQNPELDEPEISTETVLNAYKLILYFEYQALWVRNIMGKDDDFSAFDKRQIDFVKLLPPAFTKTDAVVIGDKLSIPTRTIEDWLKPSNARFCRILSRVSHGNYELKDKYKNINSE